MKEKHTLDELFREKLAGHTSQVPDHLWSGIVNKRGRRRAGGLFGSGLFWLLVSGGLLVGVGAYLSEGFVAQIKEHVINMASSGLSESNIDNAQALANENSYNGSNTNSSETVDNSIAPSNKTYKNGGLEGSDSDLRPENGSDDIKKNSSQSQSGGVDNSPPSTTKAVSAGVVSSTGAGSDPFAIENTGNSSGSYSSHSGSKVSGEAQGSTQSSSNGQLGLRTNTSTASVDGGLNPTSEPTLLKIRPTDLNSAPLSSDPDLSLTPTPTVHGPKKSRWYVDVSAGYYSLDQKWENENSSGKDQRVGAETFNNAIDLGLRGGIQFESGVMLGVGVTHSTVTSEVQAEQAYMDSTLEIIDNSYTYFDTNQNVWVTVSDFDTVFVNSEIKRLLNASNKYNVIQIPLSVGYSIQKGRFELGVNVGASFDLLVSSSASYPVLIPNDTSNVLLDEDQVLAMMSGKSSIRSGLSLFGNISIAYMFSEKLHFLVEPTIRSSTIPFDGSGPPYVKLNYYGIRGGLRYFF